MRARWSRILLLFVAFVATLANLWQALQTQQCNNMVSNDNFAPPVNAVYNISTVLEKPPVPIVACFFMVGRRSLDISISVRYSNWGKRCSQFVIVSNGVHEGKQSLDRNTIIVGIDHIIEMEILAMGWASNNHSSDAEHYMTFPSPQNETKQNLTLKSFYSWIYMARNYLHQVDFVMKADPDTYMIMDNYLEYLQHFPPHVNAYIGRVFKTNGNHHDPFVTGLSATLSKATARLLLTKSSLHDNKMNECSAEVFGSDRYGENDDYALAQCLSSLGVYPAYTRDEKSRERFMHFDPNEHVFGNANPPDWYDMYSFTPQRPRKDCCSRKACAFHYVPLDRQNDTLVWDEIFEIWRWKNISRSKYQT